MTHSSIAAHPPVSPVKVVVAFITVYLVWGSTYFFIRIAVMHFPPFLMLAFRFTIAGLLLLGWCILRGEKILDVPDIKRAGISGVLLLLFGNGSLAWTEQWIPSSLAAVFVASVPVWFVMLDRPRLVENLSNKLTVSGLFLGFCGVILLLGENALHSLSPTGKGVELTSLGILLLGSVSWAGGSLYSKYHPPIHLAGPVNVAWQMLIAGIIFSIVSASGGEWSRVDLTHIPSSSWLALSYLITMGSLVGYSTFIWLLNVRPATQVSTYAYVNPVVAVLLGVFFGGESVSLIQVSGLAIILTSVLLLNLTNYRKRTALT